MTMHKEKNTKENKVEEEQTEEDNLVFEVNIHSSHSVSDHITSL